MSLSPLSGSSPSRPARRGSPATRRRGCGRGRAGSPRNRCRSSACRRTPGAPRNCRPAAPPGSHVALAGNGLALLRAWPCTSALGLLTRRYSAASAKLSPLSKATVRVFLSLAAGFRSARVPPPRAAIAPRLSLCRPLQLHMRKRRIAQFKVRSEREYGLPGAEMDFERAATVAPTPLIDPFGRAITYLRVSVTDRCDFRCVYCMSENMTFLPKADLLTLEELDRLCSAFVARGVRKLRLTGGEPLVRRGIMTLFRSLSRHLGDGALDELTLTTNGSQLAEIRRRARGLRREAHQRLARHARRRQVPRDHALGRARQGAGRHRRRAGGRPRGQDQRGRAARASTRTRSPS